MKKQKRFDRDVWIRNIRAVEREHLAVHFSVHRSVHQAKQDPSILPGDLRIREIDLAAERLEGTYIIRLFAEFETALRAFLRKTRRRPPPSRTRDLLESVAAIVHVAPDLLENAHKVRKFRNVLIHQGEATADKLTITEARGWLCVYLSFLPRNR